MKAVLTALGAALLLLSSACAHADAESGPNAPPSAFWQSLALEPVQPLPAPVVLRGKVTVVNFFASWCFPCIALVPRLMELQETHRKDGLQVVGIGMDLDGSVVLTPFIEHYQLNYPVFYPTPEMREGKSAFGKIQELPVTVVIGRHGELLNAYGGVLEQGALDKLLERALKTP